MNILSWILVGLVAGIIAKLLMPGRDPGGCIITILLGIAGALLGGFLAGLFGFGYYWVQSLHRYRGCAREHFDPSVVQIGVSAGKRLAFSLAHLSFLLWVEEIGAS